MQQEAETNITAFAPWRVAALMACHNRRNTTVQCLKSLAKQEGLSTTSQDSAKPVPGQFDVEVFLLDDASTDGTAEAAAEVWPNAHIIAGNGELFWCGGMRSAWKRALTHNPDYYLLLNDDTMLEPDAILRLLDLAPTPESETIAVAPIADPDTGKVVCGGHIGHENYPRPLTGSAQECDTMNANCVLVPRAVHRKVGMFHEGFTHAMGDYDYGFEARRRGVRIVQAGKILGWSKPNDDTGTWRDRSLPKRRRLHLLWSSHRGGLPFREWALYCRRNYGWIWPYRCASPTLHVLFSLRVLAFCSDSLDFAIFAI